jgi:5-methylcytosine-specific restriction protein A
MKKIFYAPQDPSFIKQERAKAQELKKTQWWKQKLQAGLCYYCEKKFTPAELSMDHKVPIGRGGQSTKSNCVVACKDCNSKKQAQTSAELLMNQETD